MVTSGEVVALPPEIGTTVDLEIGTSVVDMPLQEIEAAKPEKITWIERCEQLDEPHRRKVWMNVSRVSFIATTPLFSLLDNPDPDSPNIFSGIAILLMVVYCILLIFVSYGREPLPYTLRSSEKQLYESAFVFVCSCWAYFFRDVNIFAIILGLALMFNVIPMLNLWWCFTNIGLEDCCLIVAIDVALVCFRNYGGFAFTVVAGIGVALQLIKEPFRQYCSIKTKHSTEQLVI